MRTKSFCTGDMVCHGDFNPSNIIISEKDGRAYVIDRAHVTRGNASADVARTSASAFMGKCSGL